MGTLYGDTRGLLDPWCLPCPPLYLIKHKSCLILISCFPGYSSQWLTALKSEVTNAYCLKGSLVTEGSWNSVVYKSYYFLNLPKSESKLQSRVTVHEKVLFNFQPIWLQKSTLLTEHSFMQWYTEHDIVCFLWEYMHHFTFMLEML